MSSRPATYIELIAANAATTSEWLQRVQNSKLLQEQQEQEVHVVPHNENSKNYTKGAHEDDNSCFDAAGDCRFRRPAAMMANLFDLDVLYDESDYGQYGGGGSLPAGVVHSTSNSNQTTTGGGGDDEKQERTKKNVAVVIPTAARKRDHDVVGSTVAAIVAAVSTSHNQGKHHRQTNYPPPTREPEQVITPEKAPPKKRNARKRKVPDGEDDEMTLTPEAWNNCFQSLVQFKEKHGHTDVRAMKQDVKSKTYIVSDAEESKTINILEIFADLIQKEKRRIDEQQARHEQIKSPILTPERIKALDEINFIWVSKLVVTKVSFEERFVELRTFKEKYGHCFVPTSYSRGLSQFCSRLRYSYKKKCNNVPIMSAERIATLNSIGFEWFSKTEAKKMDKYAGKLL